MQKESPRVSALSSLNSWGGWDVSGKIMKKGELKAIAVRGEDSRLQFKQDIRNVDALAAEMVAFSNSEGGRILIGITDAGELRGVPRTEIGRINQLISNAASQHVRSPISSMTEKEFSVIEEIPPQDFGYTEDEMTVRNCLEDFFTQPFPEFYHPLLVTGGAKMSSFA